MFPSSSEGNSLKTFLRNTLVYKSDHKHYFSAWSCAFLTPLLTTFSVTYFARTLMPARSCVSKRFFRGNGLLWGLTHLKFFYTQPFHKLTESWYRWAACRLQSWHNWLYAHYLCVYLLCGYFGWVCVFIHNDTSVMEHRSLLGIANHLNQDWRGVAADLKTNGR